MAEANPDVAAGELVPEAFRHDFVEDVSEIYKCPICLNLIDSPTHVPECGHVFCRTCINNWLTTSPTACCPVDNQAIDKTKLFCDNRILREIGNLKVWCKNKQLGCDNSMELNYLENHLEKCTYKPEDCPLMCGEIIASLSLDKHQLEECVKRMLTCGLCDGSMQAEEMLVHAAICPMVEVACEYCEAEPMTRKQLNKVHSKTCDKTPVSCMFAAHGCIDKIARGSLTQHCDEASLIHLNLLRENFVDREIDVEFLKTTLSDHERGAEISHVADNDRFVFLENQNREMREMFKKRHEGIQKLIANVQQENIDLKKEVKDIKDEHSNEIKILKMKYDGIMGLHATPGEVGDKINVCPFIWRVDLLECIEEKCSDVFFSYVGGYMMCLVAKMDRRSTEFKNWTISVRLLKGKNDDVLKWPLTNNIRMIVSDVPSDEVVADEYAKLVNDDVTFDQHRDKLINIGNKMCESRNRPATSSLVMTVRKDLSKYIQNGRIVFDIIVKWYPF